MNARAITLRQPWASLVAVGAKTIETRSWPTKWRGELLIHAGKHSMGVEALGLCHDYFGTYSLPLGALVASCRLVDCVPIVEHVGRSPKEPGARYVQGIHRAPADLWICTREERGAMADEDVSDQLPFGDFSPGRYAWLLEDVKATTERCPRCWGVGYLDFTYKAFACPVCDGVSVCPPVPMRGHQGLWTPKPQDWAATP